MPLKKVLILGGTREAVELAAELTQTGKWDVTTSLAGRTKEPAPVAGKVRIGGFGGPDGMAEFIRVNGIEKVIDATHPYAKTISANAIQACEQTGAELEIRTRAPWEKQDGDWWIEVGSLEAAAHALPAGARVFLALGRQYLDAFTNRDDCHFVIRMVDAPEKPPAFSSFQVITAKPSTEPEDEAKLLRENEITHIVCRNSGGKGAIAKIVAAREMGLPVIMIGR